MEVFEENFKAFLGEFTCGKTMVLSSSENDKVTSRMMSIVHIDGLFYFQTDKSFRKYHQLISNPQVALCIENIQVEGMCKEQGHPLENALFCEIYKACFNSSFKRYSFLESERLFVVEPTFVERWRYIEGVPFIETFEVKNREYKMTRYESGS